MLKESRRDHVRDGGDTYMIEHEYPHTRRALVLTKITPSPLTKSMSIFLFATYWTSLGW